MKLKSLTFATLACALISQSTFANERVDITLLGTSDIHGHFIPWDYASDKPIKAGSLSQIATKIHEIKAKEKNVILVDAGDTIQGNFVETFKDEKVNPMMLGFNQLDYDVWVLGNHEFDFGLTVLNTPIQQFKGAALAGNIYHDNGDRFLPAYKIIEKSGVKIGIIGMDTPMTEEFAKGTDRTKGLKFVDPVLEVRKVIDKIKDRVDALVLVAHMGIDNENKRPGTGVGDIAKANPELAAIVAGHMHVKIDKAVINGVIITEPYKYGRALSRIDLAFEKNDHGYSLVDKDSYTYDMYGMSSNKTLEEIYQPYHKVLRANANRKIGTLTGADLVPANKVEGIPQVQVQDTGLAALFQDVGFHYAPLANVIAIHMDNDFARMDTGPVRAKDIAYNYQYAGGEFTVYELTGKELKAYMEWAAVYFNQLKEGDVTISFNPARRSSKYSTNDMFGGVTYKIDLREPEGQRIKDITLADGTPVTDKTPIRIGMNAYRMGHLTQKGGPLEGQSFPVLFDTKAAFGEEEGTIRNLTIKYIEDVKGGKIEGKVQSHWELLGLDGYEKERAKVEALINSGRISVPTTDDGRFTNVASFNVKGKVFTDSKKLKDALGKLQKQLEKASTAVEQKRIQDEITIVKTLNS